MEPNTTRLTVYVVMALAIALYALKVRIEVNALREVAARVGDYPTMIEVSGRVTEMLEARRLAPRADVHALLRELGGELDIADAGTRTLPRERVRWTMARVPWGHLRAKWLVEYDDAGRLLRVEQK